MAPPPGPGEPSPFSLAEPDQTTALLESAGLTDVEIEPGPDEAVLYGATDIGSLAERVLEQNPGTAGRLAAVDPSVRAAAIRAAAEVLAEHREDDVVRMGAGTWIVTARRN